MNKRSVFIVISQWDILEVAHTHEIDEQKTAHYNHQPEAIATTASHAVDPSSTITKSKDRVLKRSSVGSDILSHIGNNAVPSALADLTSGFEMRPGVPPRL